MSKLYDITVFGASGFTGEFILDYLVKKVVTRPDLKIAIAGRDSAKLQKTLAECQHKTGLEWVTKVPILVANVDDADSLEAMAKSSKVVITSVGPFRFYGESVVKACLAQSAHYVDVAGEPEFLESVQLKYDAEAKSKKVYVVGSCAFLSGYAELAVHYTKQAFPGKLNEIANYAESKGFSYIFYGTWKSIVYSLANHKKLTQLRKLLYPTKLPSKKWRQTAKYLFYEKLVNHWCIPYPVSDASVVYRTQRYLSENENANFIQYKSYSIVPSWISGVCTILSGVVLHVCSQFRFTRWILLKYPHILTFGFVKTTPPTLSETESGEKIYTLIGKGWKEGDNEDKPPNTTIVTRLAGADIGYKCTADFCIEAAFTILDEADKMPKGGGVYTSGAAFHRTTYPDRLKQRFNFSVLKLTGEDVKTK